MLRIPLLVLLLAVPALDARTGRVVVAPFRDAGELPNAEWIGDSIAEAIRDALLSREIDCVGREEREEAARSLGLAANGRRSLAATLKLAERLQARYAVAGEFEIPSLENGSSPAQAPLKVRARLIDLERLATTADFSEEGLLAELGQIQARLAGRILCRLLEENCPAEPETPEAPVRLDALESYVRGLTSASADQKHRLLAQAALLAPEFSAPRLELARMQLAEGGYRAAIRWLEQIAPGDPRYREAAFLLGVARYQTGDYRGAVESFSALAREKPAAAVWNNLGLALHRLGDPGALEAVEQAAALDPADPDYQFNAGYLLWRRGDLAGARTRLEAAAALDPNDAGVQQLLERSTQQQGPRRGDLSAENLERLKESLVFGSQAGGRSRLAGGRPPARRAP